MEDEEDLSRKINFRPEDQFLDLESNPDRG